MLTKLTALEAEALALVAATKTVAELREVEIALLGRKGRLTEILRGLKDLPPAEKGAVGKAANDTKVSIETAIATRTAAFENERFAKLAETEWIDPTAPGVEIKRGTLHPITQFLRETERVFTGLGFTIASGPLVEDDFHNFTGLNIPADHPARDGHDTLFLEQFPNLLMRTQTSTVQIRFGETHTPPFRIIAPGKVFRKDDFDASHSPAFHQLEGLVVGPDITLSNMKAVIETAIRELVNPDATFRFRSSYFPFVEPGLEVDMSCRVCGGNGCPACKGTGWVEIAGCGMVHPNVLKNINIDPTKFAGFAFGFGVDRVVMMRHKISDIRLLYGNDLRFLKQF